MTQRLLTLLSRTEVWLGALSLAAFLVLTWALRGAPPGQAPTDPDEAEDAPGAGYRDRVVAAMVGGLLLVMAGAYLALSSRLEWSLAAFVLGIAIVLTLIAVNHRHRHRSPSLRRSMELANSALSVSLVAGILIVLNVLVFRFGGRPLDFTREGAFTLSSMTVNQLKALKRPVTFTVFFGDSPRSVQQLDRVQQLLELYKSANPERITLEYLNPYRELDKYDSLIKKYPDLHVAQGGGILIEYGEGSTTDHVVLRNNDLFDLPASDRFRENTARFESSFRGEDAVTTALNRLREGKRPRIALVIGHGEASTSELDPRKPGLGLFKGRLGSLGFEVVDVNLLHENIPGDAVLVAVVGPRTAFSGDETAKLKTAIDAGKPLLAVVGGPETPGEKGVLADLLRAYNLAVGSSVIVDPVYNYRGQPGYVFGVIDGLIKHPIVDPLRGRAVLMLRASPIQLVPGTPTGPGGQPQPAVLPSVILRTSRESWGETDLTSRKLSRDEKDEPGPLNVAVAVTDRPQQGKTQEPQPRLVLFSSRFMADNLFLDLEPTNLDVLVNSINWLRGQAELGGIAPKSHVALSLEADPLLRARLILVPTAMAFLMIIGLGLTTYMARRE